MRELPQEMGGNPAGGPGFSSEGKTGASNAKVRADSEQGAAGRRREPPNPQHGADECS